MQDGSLYLPLTDVKILEQLHEPHTGLTKTLKTAKQIYFWPNMKTDIMNVIEACSKCQTLRQSLSPEKFQITSTAKHPMDMLGADLFQIGSSHYLVIVDRFSGFPFVYPVRSLTTRTILSKFEDCFYEHGYPNTIRTDGGTPVSP